MYVRRSLIVSLVLIILAAAPLRAAERPLLVCYGDSITAGYGLQSGQSFPDALQRDLDAQGFHYKVVNQGTSGATTKDAVANLRSIVALHPAVVIVEFGGNDGLRGQPIDALRDNLSSMIEQSQRAGARVAIAAIQIPPNYGPAYTRALSALYPELAQRFHVTLVDLALANVAVKPELMQGDGIHPNAAGQKIVFANVWQALGPMLAARDGR